jgi:oligopeptide transport system ATP-binding protein
MDKILLQVDRLQKHFPVRTGFLLRETGRLRAVDEVSFAVRSGETLGLVGESGCGKSTLGRAVMRIYDPTGGEVLFEGKSVSSLKGDQLLEYRRNVQMIFQDPYSSLNPRMTVGRIVEIPLEVHGIGTPSSRREMVVELLQRVGLAGWAVDRYPHEFSGGQRQRIAIARALAVRPKLIVADEPVSALDVSVQAQILNLLKDLQKEFQMAYLFIAHDLAVVKHMAERIAVMYLGKIVEMADRNELFERPRHPYTQALIGANPMAGRGKRKIGRVLQGDVPSPLNPPTGCHFHPRCTVAAARCKTEIPVLKDEGKDHWVSCHLAGKA